MIDRFGYLDGFFAAGDALGERSELGEAVDQPDTRADRRQAGHAEELMEQPPWRNTTFCVRKSIACR